MAGDVHTSAWALLCEDDTVSAQSQHPDLLTNRRLPFIQYLVRIPSNPTEEKLHELYLRLFDAASQAVRRFNEVSPQPLALHATNGGSSPISYNLAMTTSVMMICPRRKEGSVLYRTDGSEAGFVALNGTVLAGTLMVKEEEQWNILRQEASNLDSLLQAAGIPVS